MKPELFISWRYLAAKRREKFVSLINLISIAGVAIGVMTLIVVIAVMTGFDKDLRDKIIGNYSHITVTAYEGIAADKYPQIAGQIASNPHVRGISPYVQGQVLVKEEDRYIAVSLKGIEPDVESGVTSISKYLIQGKLDELADDSVIIGKELAAYLGLWPGASISVYSAKGQKNNLKVTGIFNSGMYEYDLNLIFTNIKTAQGILGLNGKFSAIAVKLDDLYSADKVRNELGKTLGFDYNLKTWTEANQNFFAALKLEKLTMFIILALIVLVASFNIISSLVVMVVEKTKDIGILKAIGMSSAEVRKIFTYQGILIGSLGIILGTLFGLILCGLLKRYQFIKLPQDIYYLDRLPVSVVWTDIAFIVLAAFTITLVSTVYPAAKAARLNPVEALRYE
ncbi:MAG: ABC transporter permease [Candidatus Omnitrophica bacterium]|nr:ABC transporter permease [Candidatus Omnitrophota bacterium]